MNRKIKEGDLVKAIGNHCWKGREGIVVQVEDIDGDLFVHVLMDHDVKIIMRPGQYKVIKSGTVASPPSGNKLAQEVLPHIQRVVNNKRYSPETRQDFVRILRDELLIYAEGLFRSKAK